MSIKVGDALPEGTFTRMTENGPAPVTTRELFEGKKVILFGVPGAFTPDVLEAAPARVISRSTRR